MRLFPAVILALLLGAAPRAPALTWKAVLVAGDDTARVFDNARVDVGRLLFLRGVAPENLVDLSASDEEEGTLAATAGNVRYALRRLAVGPGDACFIHLTSHGSKDGFELPDEDLTPKKLDAILTDGCGDRPTVVLVSACYSGVFVDKVMEKPNRIVLTAARSDRTSFGCDDNGEYNFWDECLLDHFRTADDWRSLHTAIGECIGEKEKVGREMRSYPQAFFGERVAALALPEPDGWPWLRPARLFDLLWTVAPACREPRKPPPDYAADDVCQ